MLESKPVVPSGEVDGAGTWRGTEGLWELIR